MRSAGWVGTVSAAVVLAGCTAAPTTSPPPASPSASAVARTTVPVPSRVQQIPGQPPVVHYGTVPSPETGVAYEYHLYVHCGIRAARFGGRHWAAVAPTGDPPATSMRPPDPNYLRGSMTLVAPDLARFAWDGGSADFRPTDPPLPPCM